MTDVIIIGAGVVGCAVARELARKKADILVLERGNDVSVGTSKANSGIVHGGFDAKPGSLKARYNVAGANMFERIAEELDFPYRRNGALVLSFDGSGGPKLSELYENGVKNGVKGHRIIGGDEARQIEPEITEKATEALYVPSSGITSPYEMTIAYFENAAANGVRFVFDSAVTAIERIEGGFAVTAGGKRYETRAVVNAAGVYSDLVHNMVCRERIEVIARKGEYCLLDKTCGYLTSTTLFQLPTAMGKGVLVAPTCHGNIVVGPTAEDIEDKEDVDTTAAGLSSAFERATITVPALSKRDIITQFSGLRAHLASDDFIVGESEQGFFDAAGIESPGLSSAPAIGAELAAMLADSLGLKKNDKFIPERKAIPHFAAMTDEARAALIAAQPMYGRVVCRCETVTEGEIVEAIRRGAKDLDGVKRRTRAGMGRCQSGFCSPRVMEIIARERSLAMTEVTKSGRGSELVVGTDKHID